MGMARQPEHLLQSGARQETECTNRSAAYRQGCNEVGRQVKMLYDRINRLELFDRAIILLWLESMSYDEIAAIVGISTSAVTSRLFRIKEQLKYFVQDFSHSDRHCHCARCIGCGYRNADGYRRVDQGQYLTDDSRCFGLWPVVPQDAEITVLFFLTCLQTAAKLGRGSCTTLPLRGQDRRRLPYKKTFA